MKTNDWHGLYRAGWKGLIVDEAFSHPAKFARNLIGHIYEHCITEGWLKPGDVVVDPFGGVALGGLDAMRLGLNWIGIELEPKFIDLGNQNIGLWNHRYASKLPKWGSARHLQGDSRRLLEIVAGADGIVSSPPFGSITSDHPSDSIMAGGLKMGRSSMGDGYGDTPGQLAALREGDFDAAISSPPYNPPMSQDHPGTRGGQRGHTPAEPGAFARYGNTLGQLKGLPMDGFDAAISSPPFGGSELSIDENLRANMTNPGRNWSTHAYGDGNLGNLVATDAAFDAAISSPPFESTEVIQDKSFRLNDGRKAPPQGQAGYGSSAGQLGTESGDTFWSAARLIVAQIFAALRPGGHAVWVVKSFIRDGALVDFPDQWRLLCESVGFVTLHEHRCWLVEDRGTQLAMDGNHQHHRTERKSFFRRLAERKGSPRIDYEIVWCMEKP